MNQAQAKTAIDALHARLAVSFTAAYAGRAKTLIDFPDQVNQGYYGTCGPSAALRALLQYDLDKFVALVTAVFDPAQPVFNGRRVLPEKLYEARRAEIAKKSAMYPAPPDVNAYQDTYDLDFILGSSLYTFLEKADDELFRRQRDYSESIVRLVKTRDDQLVVTTFHANLRPALTAGHLRDPGLVDAFGIHSESITKELGYPLDGLKIKAIATIAPTAWSITFGTDRGDRHFVLEEASVGFRLIVMVSGETGGIGFSTGDMALDQDGIKALMTQVVGMRSAQLVRRIDSSAEEAVRKALLLRNSYVVGLVRGYDEWNEASKTVTARTFNNAAKPPPTNAGRPTSHIEHHLAVHGITRNGNYDDVDVWSWATPYRVRIPAMHTGSYFYGYLIGQVV